MQYNFVGRILGPRGNSLKRVEALTECRVYIRGKGSVKDSLKVCLHHHLCFFIYSFACVMVLLFGNLAASFLENPIVIPFSCSRVIAFLVDFLFV